MEYVIGIKETVEILHRIEVNVDDEETLEQVIEDIDMRDFDSIDDVADYIDEFMPVLCVDENYYTILKGIECDCVDEKD